MNRKIQFWTTGLAALFFFSAGVLAQEHVEVKVKISKDGEVVKDTTYQFDNAEEASHALKMMELISDADEHMEHLSYNFTTAHTGSGEARAMVFISEDGEKTHLSEIKEDSLIWISEGDEPHVKHVIVKKSKDGETFDILVDEDFEEGDKVIKKEIKVMVSDDEDVSWHVEEGEGDHVKVIVISGSGEDHLEAEELEHEHGEEVEVKVIKKKVKK